MIVAVGITDPETDHDRIEERRGFKITPFLAKVVSGEKMQFVGSTGKGITLQDRAVVTAVIIGAALAQFNVPVVQSIECPGHARSRPAG